MERTQQLLLLVIGFIVGYGFGASFVALFAQHGGALDRPSLAGRNGLRWTTSPGNSFLFNAITEKHSVFLSPLLLTLLLTRWSRFPMTRLIK